MLEQIITTKRLELDELDAFTRVCVNALNRAPKAVEQVELVKRINELLGDPPAYASEDDYERAKRQAAEIAEFGKKQKDKGFPQLYSLLIVKLWTILESMVDELTVAALLDPKEKRSAAPHAALMKIKGPLIEFRRASPEEQAEFMADSLKQALDVALKPGVGRFEALLDPIGLGGSVSPEIRRVFVEFSHFRNSIVHKSGKADRRLLESCPWVKVSRGDNLPIDSTAFGRYLMCTYWYLLEIRGRIAVLRGEMRHADADKAQELLVANFRATEKPESSGA